MKKTIIVSVVLAVACIFMGCKQNSSDAEYLNEYILERNSPKGNKYLEDYCSETDYDFIYEVVNNTGVSIDVAPVVYNTEQLFNTYAMAALLMLSCGNAP